MRALLTVLAAAGILQVGCQGGGAIQATRDFSLTRPWQDYQRIVVHTRNGRIELTVGGGSDAQIEGQMQARGATIAEAEANLSQLAILAQPDPAAPQTLLVELQVPEALNASSPGASFVIRLPRACPAEARTSNGPIHAEGLQGPLVLATSNGAISVETLDGAAQLETSNGRIVTRGVTGDLRARSSNGAIVAENAGGKCVLETSDGTIKVVGARGDIEALTSNGTIDVDASPADAGHVRLSTTNGSIVATLPRTMRADVDLSTTNGDVRTSFGDVPVQIREKSRQRVKATLNSGGGSIVANSSNGSITLTLR